MFVAGLLAPITQRRSVTAAIVHLSGRFPEPPRTIAAPVQSSVAGTMTPTARAPVALESLLMSATVSNPIPGKNRSGYALQIGQFATANDANVAAQHARAVGLHLLVSQIAVLDSTNEPWSVVAVGEFVSEDAATRAAPRIQAVLNLRETPIIELPPLGKPAS